MESPRRHGGEGSALQPQRDLAAVAIRAGCRMVELRESLGQVGAGLGQRAAPPGRRRCLLVCRGRLVEPLGVLVVGGDQPPVRLTARATDQAVGDLGVQPRRTLGGANSAATSRSNSCRKRQPSDPHGSSTSASSSSSMTSSTCVVAQVDHRAQQAPINLAADEAAASTTGTTLALARSRANNGSYSASGTPVSTSPLTTCSM